MVSRIRRSVRPRPPAWPSACFALCLTLLLALGVGRTSTRAHPLGSPSTGRSADPAPGDGGPATNARLAGPAGLALDNAGHLYIADYGARRVRVVDLRTGIISTVAGDGETGQSGDGGRATAARLVGPEAVALDDSHLYIGDTGNPDAGGDVRVVDLRTRLISTVAGTGKRGDSGDGGPAAQASFMSIDALALDGAGHLYIGDYGTDRVRVVDLRTGISSLVARGMHAVALAVATSSTHLYVADDIHQIVSVVDLRTGAVTGIAGGGNETRDGVPATQTNLDFASALALDAVGHLYIAESTSVRVVDLHSGIISTAAASARSNTIAPEGASERSASLRKNGATGRTSKRIQ